MVPPNIGHFLNGLFVQVVIDSQHSCRRIALCTPVLLDELYHLRMEGSLVAIFLHRQVIEHLRKAGKFILILRCEFGILARVVNFFVDEVSNLLNYFYIIPPL